MTCSFLCAFADEAECTDVHVGHVMGEVFAASNAILNLGDDVIKGGVVLGGEIKLYGSGY